MKNHFQRNLGLLLIGIGALLTAFGIYGLTQPDEFRAKSRIIIPVETTDNTHICQFEADVVEKSIMSDNVLSNVLRELQFPPEQTGPTDATQDIKTANAIMALRKRLDVYLVPNTPFYEVAITEKKPKQAARCANAVAVAYKVKVFNTRKSLVESGIEELKHQLKLQEQKSSEIETDLNRLKEGLKLPSPEPAESDLEANYPEYYQTKKKLTEEQDILRLLTRKTATEETELQSLRNSPQIEIVETAVPPTSPVHRKKLLGLVLLVAGLGCCLWGLTVTRDAKLTAQT